MKLSKSCFLISKLIVLFLMFLSFLSSSSFAQNPNVGHNIGNMPAMPTSPSLPKGPEKEAGSTLAAPTDPGGHSLTSGYALDAKSTATDVIETSNTQKPKPDNRKIKYEKYGTKHEIPKTSTPQQDVPQKGAHDYLDPSKGDLYGGKR